MTRERIKKSTAPETIVWDAHEGKRVTQAGDFDIIACVACGFRHAVPLPNAVELDGVYREEGAELEWQPLSHLQTRDVGGVLESSVRRMARYLRRRSALAATVDVGADDQHLHVDEPDRSPSFRVNRARFSPFVRLTRDGLVPIYHPAGWCTAVCRMENESK